MNRTLVFLKFIIKLSVIFNWILLTNAVCEIELPSDVEMRPKYVKNYDTNYSYVIKNQVNFALDHEEMITAFCDSGFENPERNYQTAITLKCFSPKLTYSKEMAFNYHDNYVVSSTIKCVKNQWSFFAPKAPLTWCQDHNLDSFILATSNAGVKRNVIFASICFNFDHLSIGSIYYVKGNSNLTIYVYDIPVNNPLYICTPLTSCKQINDFRRFRIGNEIHEKEHRASTETSEYTSAPLMQDKEYKSIANIYEPILNISWWSKLRFGNWKRFMHALEMHTATTDNAYHIFAGTSGIIQIPIEEHKCKYESKPKHHKYEKTAPQYIWTYLEDMKGVEKFVVIGYNSPYVEFFDKQKPIFCKDICDKIEWLEEARLTFRNALYGVVVCCSLEEVKEKDILDGFPITELIILKDHEEQ